MNLEFKAYYITCYLLERFNGVCAMFAEEELFENIYTFVKTGAKDTLVDRLDLYFGLSEKTLTKAVKSYDDYLKEKKELGI
jgi:hypothetical protein